MTTDEFEKMETIKSYILVLKEVDPKNNPRMVQSRWEKKISEVGLQVDKVMNYPGGERGELIIAVHLLDEETENKVNKEKMTKCINKLKFGTGLPNDYGIMYREKAYDSTHGAMGSIKSYKPAGQEQKVSPRSLLKPIGSEPIKPVMESEVQQPPAPTYHEPIVQEAEPEPTPVYQEPAAQEIPEMSFGMSYWVKAYGGDKGAMFAKLGRDPQLKNAGLQIWETSDVMDEKKATIYAVSLANVIEDKSGVINTEATMQELDKCIAGLENAGFADGYGKLIRTKSFPKSDDASSELQKIK